MITLHTLSASVRPLLPLVAALGATAHAHVTLAVPQATAGAPYQAVLRIGHGCEGTATHTVSVLLPPGFRDARPMPKAGWTLQLRHAPLVPHEERHGRRVDSDVVEVTWRATTREAWLDNAHFDEFVLRGRAPASAGPAWFRVQQLCEHGRWDWSQVPASGTSTQGLKSPAVLLEVLPAAAAPHVH